MALLVNAGRDILTNRIKGAGTEPNFVAIGTGATAEAATQTALTTEVESRVSGTSTRQNGGVANDTYQVVGTIAITGTRGLQEAGLFDVITTASGNMLLRGIYTVINLVNGDSLQITAQLRFT